MNFYVRRELRKINHITVEEPDKKKEFGKRIKSKAEDCLLWIVEHLPEKLIPGCVMDWTAKYLDKRMAELEVEYTQANWKKVYVEKAAEELKQK